MALEAVLTAAGPVDDVWCAGDIVGYGPQPNAVCDRLRGLDAKVVVGNHDATVNDAITANHMHAFARRCIELHVDALTPENRAWLASSPEARSFDLRDNDGVDAILLTHGTPDETPYLGYIHFADDAQEAASNLRGVARPAANHLVFGHTHIPAIWQVTPDPASRDGGTSARDLVQRGKTSVTFPWSQADGQFLLNPGSVGQPRDSDSRACYMILEIDAAAQTFTASLARTAYDARSVVKDMIVFGYPANMALRLLGGK